LLGLLCRLDTVGTKNWALRRPVLDADGVRTSDVSQRDPGRGAGVEP